MPHIDHQFPAIKAFIWGVDVTEDLFSCTLNWHDGRAPNTAEITLSNLNDRYVITPHDMYALYGSVKKSAFTHTTSKTETVTTANTRTVQVLDLNSIVPGATINVPTDFQVKTTQVTDVDDAYYDAVIESFTREVKDETKRRVLNGKIKHRIKSEQPDLDAMSTGLTDKTGAVKSNTTEQAYLRGDMPRYPFQVGDCIFHSNDPVRIFVRDPADPNVWYYGFSGFVTDYVDSVGSDNDRTVTIRFEDVLRIFRYARITTNPGVFDIDFLRNNFDTVFQTTRKEILPGLSLPEVMYTWIFGSTRAGVDQLLDPAGGQVTIPGVKASTETRVGVEGSSQYSAVTDAVGAFNFNKSQVFLFGSQSDVEEYNKKINKDQGPVQEDDAVGGKTFVRTTTLEAYQLFVDHRVSVNDLLDDAYPTETASATLDYNRIMQGDANKAVEEAITAIGTKPHVYPVDFGAFYMLLPTSLGTSLSRNLVLKDLIDSIALRTDYSTRLQQIYNVCEKIEFSFYATPKGDLVCEMPLYDFEPHDFGPDYERRYTISKNETVSWDKSFSDEHVRTVLRTHYNIVPDWTLASSLDVGQAEDFVFLFPLIPQFGVREQKQDPQTFMTSRAAAILYGNVKLNQINSDARNARLSTTPKLGMGPNRPVLFEERDFVSTVRNVSYAINWGEGVEFQLGTNYIRAWDGQIVKDRHVYNPLGGSASRPLNYAVLCGTREIPASFKSDEEQASNSENAADPNVSEHLQNLQANVDIIETYVQEHFNLAKKPDLVTSTYRSASNQAEQLAAGRGTKNSLHQTGDAVDLGHSKYLPLGLTQLDIYTAVAFLKATGKIDEGDILAEDANTSNEHVHYEINKRKSRSHV